MGNALITFFSIKSEYSRCPNVSTVLMRDARHPARSVAVCPCVAKDSVDSVQTSVNHDDSEAGSVSSTNDRSYIPRSHCYTLPCKQEVEDALSLTGLRDRSSTGHTRKNTTNIESVMGVCELEDNSSSVCNHNSLTDISELEEEEAQEEDDMGPMDCADAEVYYFKNDAHYADMDSIIFRSPPAVCYSSKQLWRAYVYGKGIWHQPRQELVPNTPLVFTSLLHELEAYCGQHYTQSVLAWRSTVKVGRRVNPAGDAAASSYIYYMGPVQFMSCGEMWRKAIAFGLGLRALGIRPGDFIAIRDDCRWEWMVSCFGAWSQGVVVVVLSAGEAAITRAALDTHKKIKLVLCKSSEEVAIRTAFQLAQERKHEENPGEESGASQAYPPSRRTKLGRPLFAVTQPLPTFEATWEGTEKEASDTQPQKAKEALWWSDVLAYGNRKLREAQTRDAATYNRYYPLGDETKSVESCSSAVSSFMTVDSLHSFTSALSLRTEEAAAGHSLPPIRPTDLAFIVYSPGISCGVMLSHGALKASVQSHDENIQSMLGKRTGESHLYDGQSSWRSWLPRRSNEIEESTYILYNDPHDMYQFTTALGFLKNGFLLCFGSPRTLFDHGVRPLGDLKTFKPLVFFGTPKVLGEVHHKMRQGPSHGYTKLLFDYSYEIRRQAVLRGEDTPFLNRYIFHQSRQLLGERCRFITVTQSSIKPELQEYLQVVTGASVGQYFSANETAGCGIFQVYFNGDYHVVGGPSGPVEVKLRDVGEWSHRCCPPCGELLVRGAPVMCGYYQQPELTASLLEPNGWLHTCEIVQRNEDGTFALLARTALGAVNANGLFLDLENLEKKYSRHPICARDRQPSVCVMVHPHYDYICAIVRTSDPAIQHYFESRNTNEEEEAASKPWNDFMENPSLQSEVLTDMNEHVRRLGALPHERLRHVYFVKDQWTAQNHLLTVTGRLHRPAIEIFYADVVVEFFAKED